jgi:hypothetical protein
MGEADAANAAHRILNGRWSILHRSVASLGLSPSRLAEFGEPPLRTGRRDGRVFVYVHRGRRYSDALALKPDAIATPARAGNTNWVCAPSNQYPRASHPPDP